MLKSGETYWHCTNRDCGVTAACDETERELETRVCDCGSLMKREPHAEVFSYLNFLREETGSKTVEVKEKEETSCEN